uniref:Uncharacterized protein n=1 Tax=Anopheles dirus TaxID=7168 RepID=A0A182NWR9_9DIPT
MVVLCAILCQKQHPKPVGVAQAVRCARSTLTTPAEHHARALKQLLTAASEEAAQLILC